MVAVATGRFGVEDLASHEPDVVLPGLDDLEAFITALETCLRKSLR